MTRHADGDFTPDFTPPLYDEHYDEDCDESQNGSVPPSEQGHKTMPKRRGNRRETSQEEDTVFLRHGLAAPAGTCVTS